MEKRKLISMVDYVLEVQFPQTKEQAESESVLVDEFYKKVTNYAKFLSMPLTLGMFVPVDGYDNFLEEPKTKYEPIAFWNSGCIDEQHNYAYGEYQASLDDVLFEGFSVDENEERSFLIFDGGKSSFEYFISPANEFVIMDGMNCCTTIDDITKHNLTLTKSAITKYQI